MKEDFPLDPRLRALAHLAAAQPVPRIRVTIEDVRRTARVRARARSRTTASVLTVAAIAAAAVVWFRPLHHSPTVSPTETIVSDDISIAIRPPHSTIAPMAPPVEREVEGPQPPPTLATLVTLEVIGNAPPPVILDPWSVSVTAGDYHIRVAAAAESELWVQTTMHRYSVGPGSDVRLEVDGQGRIRSRAFDSQRPSEPRQVPRGAAQLANAAEEAMAKRQPVRAIQLLRELAVAHPRSPETQTGLVDLARLELAHGDSDRGYCAYRLFLDHSPDASVRPEVERALRKFATPPTCRGLTPEPRG